MAPFLPWHSLIIVFTQHLSIFPSPELFVNSFLYIHKFAGGPET